MARESVPGWLTKRIRELEEEKAYAIEQWRVRVRELEARLEKAEARVAELETQRYNLEGHGEAECGTPLFREREASE